jgi:hydroxymethylglutaryl-CoA lyase
MTPSRVRLFEVCLRDGLQNESAVVSTDTKVEIAERLVDAGFEDIEITSFVRARWVPQLADASEVVRRLHAVEERQAAAGTPVRFWALVPNTVGLDRALDAGVGHIATFLSASESHNLKNVNRTVRESLSGLESVIGRAKAEGLQVRSYVSTAFGCPYEGEVDPARVQELAFALREAGADVIALGDTTGMGHPAQVQSMVERLCEAGLPIEDLALHFHDTRGTAIVNAWTAWHLGVTRFDGSVSGVGGCPYAPGAAGNACTQDLVHLFERMDGRQEPPEGRGPITGVDLEAVGHVGRLLEEVLGHELTGRYHRYWKGHLERKARTA